MEVDCAGTSFARRRRERRLRSWWRHERMTVAMELAVATHHSSPKGGWPGATHGAPRGQTTESSGGRRPGVLQEPEVVLRMRLVKGFFAFFPMFKKVRQYLRTRGRNCLRTRVHGHRQPHAWPTVLEKEERRRRVQEEAAEAMDQARLLLEQAVKRRKLSRTHVS